jgi:DNA-binding response OmpR family regulator
MMKKVIVQDTDSDLLETMTIILEEASYEVLPILNYHDVLQEIGTFKPKLVLLDYMLSGEESKQLCKTIKKDFPAIPIVALSCNHQIKDEFAQAGFDDFINKPFELDELFVVLRKYL